MITRRQALAGFAGGLTLLPRSEAQSPAAKPNIVLIVADDLGFGEIPGETGLTPNVNSIAAQGVRFEQGYVSCPVCAPTRAGLLTGRYQQRFGFEFNPGPIGQEETDFGLPRSETTLAERLKGLGYATGMVGKWHLGLKPGSRPTERGFDEYFGFLSGAHPYTSNPPRNPIYRGTEPVEEKEYLTDAFGREAAGFVERRRTDPFFLYLAFNAVHAPLESIEKYTAGLNVTDPKRRTFLGMLAAMDAAVGRVLGTLKRHNLTENTLVFFISDNGGPTQQTTSANTPYRGFKGQVLEGGIHVPFAMQWPGRVRAGQAFAHPVIALDIHATAWKAAGGSLPKEKPLDGVDLVPFATGATKGAPPRDLYWRFGPQRAIRSGDRKLLSLDGSSWELYDLAKDPGERNNLESQRPGEAKELQARFAAWDKELMDPRWTRGGGARPRARRPL